LDNPLETSTPNHGVDNRDLSEQVYHVLKTEILSGTWSPGHRLSLGEFAERFGTSVTPIRDAIRLLAADNLVELVPRRGAFVTRPSVKSIEEVFQIRQMVECFVVDAVIQKGPSACRELEALITQMAATNVGELHSDYSAYIQLDQRFHQSMVDCAGNDKLSQVYANMRGHLLVERALYRASDQRASRTLVEHQAILAAIEQHDAEAARTAILHHLQSAKAEILQHFPGSWAAD
jgi:DNA-binding GntR family transcriptional regulator